MRNSILLMYQRKSLFKFSPVIKALQQPVSKCCLILIFIMSMVGGLSAQTIKTVGTGGDYATLFAALPIVGALTGDVELQIISDFTETSAPTLAASATLTSLKIYPTGAARTITLSAPAIQINIKSNNVTIDGTLGGVGTGLASLNFKGIVGATLPTSSANGIVVAGASTQSVTGVTVKNCNIYDFQKAAIWINSYVNGCTISNNSIYNDWTVDVNTLQQFGVFVGVTPAVPVPAISTYGLTITGNYIGGNAPLATGTWLRTQNNVRGIYINAQNTTAPATNLIQGNIIQNISSGISGTVGGIHGIEVLSNNGSTFVTTNNIDGNTFANLTVPATALQFDIKGIYSVNNTVAPTGGTAGLQVNITNNQINNLTNNTTFAGATSDLCSGINLNSTLSASNVNKNTIHDLSSFGPNAIVGIDAMVANPSTSTFISQNTIYSLNNKCATSNAAIVIGIQANMSTTANNTSRVWGNKIYDLNSLTTGGSPSLIGLNILGGTSTYDNNMINLGPNVVSDCKISGIQSGVNAVNYIYYNSVNIEGGDAASASTNVTAALSKSAATTTNNVYIADNIFVNNRITSANKNYAIYLIDNQGVILNNNNYYAGGSNKVSLIAAVEANTLPVIPTESNSLHSPVTFVNTAIANLHITDAATQASLSGKGIPVNISGTVTNSIISNDFDNAARSATNTTIGAQEFSAVFAGATWNGTTTDWNSAANWSTNAVPTASIDVFIPAVTNKPVVTLDASTPAVCKNIIISSGTTLTIPSGKALSVTGTLTNNSTGGVVIQSDVNGTGSLIAGSIAGTGTSTVQRFMTSGAWHMVSSPLSGQTVSNFLTMNTNIPVSTLTTGNRGMMEYIPASDTWSTFNDGSVVGNLLTGKGFAMRIGATPDAVTFYGLLQAGPITASGLIADKFNLIGNPYTSAIGINANVTNTANFLSVNSANLDPSFGGIYIWDKTDAYNGITGNYTTISNVPFPQPTFDVQQGQSFFVKMNTTATSVSFTPEMQFHNSTLALKASNAAVWPIIKLKATVGTKESSTIIAFNSDMTKGLDPTYDAGLFKGASDLVVYSKLVEDNGIQFAIQALPDNDYSSMIIPIGLDFITGGEVVFSSEVMNLPLNCKVILEDKLTNTFTDLSTNVYKTTVAANSIIADRFRLKTSNATTGLDKATLVSNLTAFTNRNIDIQVNGKIGKNAVATLYDINGRVVLIKKLEEGNKNIIPLPNIKVGIYMLSVNDNGRMAGFKILVRE